jgi:WD40 repeat protein
MAPDGRTLAVGREWVPGVELLDWPTRAVRGRLEDKGSWAVRSLAYSPDGSHLATASADQRVGAWNLAERTFRLLSGPAHPGEITVALGPDRQVASLGKDREVCFWDLDSGRVVNRLPAPLSQEAILALSLDGKVVATAHSDSSITLWDRSTSRPRRRLLPGHQLRLFGLVFSSDGKALASWGEDRGVRVWDVESGEVRQVLQGHAKWVLCSAFSPDGKVLATGGEDLTVKLWSVTSGQELLSLERHTGDIRALAWSADGTTLVSGGGSDAEAPGEVFIWTTAPGAGAAKGPG